MGRYVFKLPDVGEGTAEAEIVAWHVKVGDAVAEDQQLADMMTDKATVEMESPVAGKVLEVAGEVGDMIPIGSVLVFGHGAEGHVVIRTKTGFVSDYSTKNRCKYPLVAVYGKFSS